MGMGKGCFPKGGAAMKSPLTVKLDPDLEAGFPVTISVPRVGYLKLTAAAARKLASDLFVVHCKIENHFQCKAPFSPRLEVWMLCGKPGTVKRDGKMRQSS